MSQESKKYKLLASYEVKKIMLENNFEGFKSKELEMELIQYPNTKHRRDIDGGIKIMLDSMQMGGIFNNDYQVKSLKVKIMPSIEKEKGAFVQVIIKSID